ncbi:MAG: proline--tRNA ligase [Chloroflexi bacterium]|nr:proline--tRNA ligase [Chloroflexota bacterium]MCY3715565.1 proline--tRNA ligase [Chloroflexota bacterium]MDE2650697.1 proline--tRNA ligase [Chloroflexota bacterium]MXX49794.1 proline--tRNA ligase [Chloroflexota bacterium]MYA94263.1 proline--tRNA ligase [Chloroflexota bacterium]
MAEQAVTAQSEDFSRWYNEIVYRADLAAPSPVRGCVIIKPYGYEIWEGIKAGLDRRFKATGHQNAYFPLFIPESYIRREAEHVEGFSPELAVVTHAGGKELEEPLVVRPTSETVIGEAFSDWIQSYRDLPLLINQWANVVRWELRTRPFLRTAEFLWQEGHTAHATHDEAEAETRQMLDIYAEFAEEDAAIPVIKGEKSRMERFAGALRTYTIEAMMRDKRALQSGTSHNLGQNFAKAFDIDYLSENNAQEYCWTTSWGLSTRMVGAVVMTHGDDKGLRLPPKLAPYQVVIVPIIRRDAQASAVMETVERLRAELAAAGIRVHVDRREGQSPGFKFNDWEMRGVPVRLEIGPKDVENDNAVLARRDIPGRAGKQFVPQARISDTVRELLADIQRSLLDEARAFRDEHIVDVAGYAQLQEVIEAGDWARAAWAGGDAHEQNIKDETGATIRCFPFEQPDQVGNCIVTGNSADKVALFAKAY